MLLSKATYNQSFTHSHTDGRVVYCGLHGMVIKKERRKPLSSRLSHQVASALGPSLRCQSLSEMLDTNLTKELAM